MCVISLTILSIFACFMFEKELIGIFYTERTFGSKVAFIELNFVGILINDEASKARLSESVSMEIN